MFKIKTIILVCLMTFITGCATGPQNRAANTIRTSTTFSTESEREKFNVALSEILSGTNTIGMEEAVHLDKRDKDGIKSFMESMKTSMALCNSATTTAGITSKAILISCEPFFRHLARSRYGDNTKILNRYGMGRKIAFAIAAGAAGAAMVNSNNYSTVFLAGITMVTATSLALLPNDWEQIAPYVNKIETNAYNTWLIANINETVMREND